MEYPTQPQFEELVKALMSADNKVRRDAEGFYDKLKENPAWICCAHLSIMKELRDETTAYMCSILLRRLLDPSAKVFANLAADAQNNIKSDLVQLFQKDVLPRFMRKGITGCMSQVILSCAASHTWDDVVPFLLEALEKGNSDIRLSCVLVFKQVATCIVDKFMASSHMQHFCRSMTQCLEDSNHALRVATMEALSQFIGVMDHSDFDKIRPIIPCIVSSLNNTLQSGDESSTSSMLDPLVYISDNNVEFFGRYMPDVVQTMMAFASQEKVEQSIRTYAVEFMLSFCEHAPKVARGVKEFVRSFFELCLRMSTYPVERDDWATSYEEDENDDTICDYDVGLEGLDRLSCALKGKTIEPIATEFILRNSQSPEWPVRASALMCIGQIAEGCHDAFLKNIHNIVTLVLSKIEDQHPRVRYACMASMAQLFTDFEDGLEEEYPRMIPAVIARLQDNIPRIQAIAAAAVCNFSDGANGSHVDNFANDVLSNVCGLLGSSPHHFVREQCLAAIAAVAENCGEQFAQFYDRLVPILRPILSLDDRKEHRLMKCRALEAFTLMAVAVGKERFAPDAANVCQYIASQVQVQRDADDPFLRYLLRGWACMAKTLKRDFGPYLGDALRPVMDILRQEVSMEVLGDDEGDEEEAEEGVSIISLCVKGVGDKKVKLHTALIEDKVLCLTVLLSCLEETGELMVPFMDEVVAQVVPMLTFPYVDEVRDHSAQALSHIIHIASMWSKSQGGAKDDMTRSLALKFMQDLIKALRKEQETHTATEFLSAIHIILENTPHNFLPQEAVAEVRDVMKQVFDLSIKRRQELFESMEGEDDEDVDGIMEEHEDEENLLIEAVDVIGRMLKTQESFYNIFIGDFLPKFAELLDDNLGNTEHKIALCVLDDFLDIKPESAMQYFDKILGAMLKFACDENYEVMQSACFGLGLCADLLASHPQARQAASQAAGGTDIVHIIAQKLIANMNGKLPSPLSRDEYYHAMANVASAAMKLVRHFGADLRGSHEGALFSGVVNLLPIRNDEVEAQFVHRTILQMCCDQHPAAGQHRPRVLDTLRKLASSEISENMDDETKNVLSSMGAQC